MRYLRTIFLFVFFSCSKSQDKNLYVGDLRFNDFFRFGNFYGLPDSLITRIRLNIDTVHLNNKASDNNLVKLYLNLKEQNLLYKPFINLQQQDEESLVTMFLDSIDYEQFKDYKWKELRNNNSKVMIWAKTRKVDQFEQVIFLYCTDLVEVKVVDGETFPLGRSKFKISDYE